MRRVLVLMFLLCCSIYAIGQVKIDSLWIIWNDQTKSDSIRLGALHDIYSKAYLYSKPDSTILIARMAYNYAESKNLKKEMATALYSMGIASSVLADFHKAIDFQKQSIEISESINDDEGLLKSLNNLGGIYLKKNDHAKAIECYVSSLEIAKATMNIEKINHVSRQLYNVYEKNGQYEDALEMHKLFQITQDSINNVRIEKVVLKNKLEYEYEKKLLQDQIKYKEQEYVDRQSHVVQQRYIFLGGIALLTLVSSGFGYYLIKRHNQNIDEQKELHQKIQVLKKRISSQSISFNGNHKEISLNKVKIEKSINVKLGESSWMILNLLFKNPSISNKEIASEVSLSLEGVSSSLRRMYTTFDVKSSHNKKVALIMKVVEISTAE